MTTRSPAGANQPDIDTWIVESNRATVFKSLVAAPTQHWGWNCVKQKVVFLFFSQSPIYYCIYDEVSDNWVAQRPDYKSALGMVKMVLKTQCYQNLQLTLWFQAKKSKEMLKNQHRWFYYVNSAPYLRNDQKSPKKNRSLNCDLLIFFVKVWYILDASRWKLTSRRFRICVAKGGRVFFRLSYGRPKFTLFSKKKKPKMSRQKKFIRPQFSKYEPTLIRFGSDILKFVDVSVFCNGSF